ncbi:hypothetical protein ACSBR1_019072 [Camellia fascicularis]
MDPKTLFKLFTKFGTLKDVFIPQKRRKFTNTRFGFVRYVCLVAVKVAVTKANGLWVEDREIQVKMAEYDRFKDGAQNRNQPKGSKGANEACGRNVHCQHGMEEAEMLWFRSKEEKDAKLSLVREWCRDWCEFVKEWEPGACVEQERCLWLRCHGVPLSMWNRNTFNKIGNIWESVIRLQGDICQPKSFSYGRVRIATQCMDFINKTINLECKGRLYLVVVCEEQPVSIFDNGRMILSEVEDVHSSNEVVNQEPVAGCGAGNEVDDMAKEVEEQDDDLANSDTVVEETQCGRS